MDVLDDVLGTLNLQGVLYFRTDFSMPWSVKVPDLEQAARFHLVVQGVAHVTLPSGKSVDLGPGDVILIPRGRSHVISDAPGRKPALLETVIADSAYDGQGVFVLGNGNARASTQMVCGHFSFRHGADHPLLRALPDHLVMTAATRARAPLLDEILRMVVQRVFASEIGSASSVRRLSEIVFIELLRADVEQNDDLRLVLEAFQDLHIGKSLHLIHQQPAEPWTVERLAASVGMSRSRYAERFRDLLGMGPMAYLSDWRLQKSLALLDAPRLSVKEVATQTGYRSSAAFSRAFSGKFGVAPTEYRRVVL